ncbi:ADP-ribosylation factor [Drechmeria coniospora]|uniref:ADP-ribosylation factor n=1 Tax=Drechmeria coniospora TaxID=98403 RepID=A0A151GSX4_DRECN|nr:ADP-ribosylation factor [Drechmeria coniospora]KYK60219.1 ADP-ribosylation factor [Drechmeria coniospora]
MALSSPYKENDDPADASSPTRQSASTSPIRSSTLSWQQRRPNSRGGSRPLSIVAAQNATQKSLAGTQEPASATEHAFSREQIAHALGTKDTSFFRQTADRGLSSAAYRRNQVEDDDRLDMGSLKAQLPGMSAETAEERPASHSEISAPLQGSLDSPISLHPPRQQEPIAERYLADQTMTSPTGRSSPVRAASPTKGMGGFVQSAMMKRSDSVKRWSVTSPPGLTRADSVASHGVHDRGASSKPGSRPQSMIRAGPKTPTSSRPTSQHGFQEAVSEAASRRSTKDLSLDTERAVKQDDGASLPTSPTKTMDPRRWSPTKSSWLESALNRPESPKLPAKANQSQPAWRSELHKKADRSGSSTESSRPSSAMHKHQVSIDGLMRQSPLGEVAKPNTTGLGGIYSPPPHANRPAFGHVSKASMSEIAPKQEVEDPKENPKPATETPSADKKSPARGPPVRKAKSETPAKIDFRANLKPRAIPRDESKASEPEFKNVFGNLRRTKTQNYVAPDELKNNILRGKAALNVTDGPKKSERKDEFKEAILKKREDFKKAQAEGKGVTRGSTATSEKPVPEGLTKRAELGSGVVGSKKDAATRDKPKDEARKPSSTKPTPGTKRISSQSAFTPRSPNAAGPPSKSPGLDKPSRGLPETGPAKPVVGDQVSPTLQKGSSASSRPQQGREAGGGKPSDQFNSALAGMLARGPPPMAANGGRTSDESALRRTSDASDVAEAGTPGPQLTHMTKSRARGPRRKAPTKSSSTSKPGIRAGSNPSTELISDSVLKPDAGSEKRTLSTMSRPAPLSLPKPAAPEVTENLGHVQTPTSALAAKTHEKTAEPTSAKEPEIKRVSKLCDDTQAVRMKPDSPKSPLRLTHQRTGSMSPTKLSERPLPSPSLSPTKTDRDSLPSMKDAPRSPRSPRSPRPGASMTSHQQRPKPSLDESQPEPASPRKQPRAVVRPLSGISAGGLMSPTISSPLRSPTKQAGELSMLLTNFFGSDRPKAHTKVDTAEILMHRPSATAKIMSTGFQMFQISEDGKKIPVSAQNERVLFEKEMYLCAHNFVNASGKNMIEVYFWVGDEVSDVMAENAQPFVDREAKALGGRLVTLRQGKEPAEFIQALGGVIIVRRGSSNKYDSLAPNMLCGRSYLGQVAFDEVDFTPSSLCAGFAYLITKSGNCSLWKGKGSDVAEVSCARLVGMDLTLTGELAEHEDGSEPESFWKLFDNGGSKPHSADHWRLKPTYDKYRCRLFCSDANARQQVRLGFHHALRRCHSQPLLTSGSQIFEISPFGQADLSSSSIFVLDAFFEMYIVVGAHANSQYTSFRIALDFAQEYSILAAGMEDRPFVPVSTVVLEGVPRDLKRVFRKWDDACSPTIMNPAAAQGLKRGRSLKVVTLNLALQVLSQ